MQENKKEWEGKFALAQISWGDTELSESWHYGYNTRRIDAVHNLQADAGPSLLCVNNIQLTYLCVSAHHLKASPTWSHWTEPAQPVWAQGRIQM